MRSIRPQALAQTALCSALLCISAYLVLPIPFSPVVITAQTLMVNLTALLLSPRQALTAVAVYLSLGLFGLPVFAGGTAGPAKLLGPAGGFYWGFLLAAPLVSWIRGKDRRFWRYFASAALVGLPLIDAMGVLYYQFLTKGDLITAVYTLVIPFLPGDVGKCALAAAMAVPLGRALARSRR